VQNLIADAADITSASTVGSNAIYRGNSAGWHGSRTDTVNTLQFTAVGGYVLGGAQLDYIFLESFAENPAKGKMGLVFTPSTKVTSPPYVIVGSNIRFDNAGKLYFGTAGETITYTWPWRIFGQTGWQNLAYEIRGSELGSNAATCVGLLVEYSLSDDNVTWGAFKEMVYSNTGTETISAVAGVYLRVRLTPKNFFKFVTKTTSFVLGEQIRNATSTATAYVRRIETDPTTATSGTLWVDTITGSWQYNDVIWSVPAVAARATMSGSAVFGAIYPFIQVSYIDALAWSTTADRTKKYPAFYSIITNDNLVTSTRVAAYNNTTGVWLESGIAGTRVLLPCPWDNDFSCKVKYRKAGYKFQDIVVPLTRFGTTLTASQVAWTRISGADPGSPSITFTDHGASPVTWNSKQWRYTIQVNDASNAATLAQWWYWITAKEAIISGFRGTALPDLIIEDAGSTYETQKGAIDGVAVGSGGCRVIDSGGAAFIGISRMQANDGSYYANVSYVLTIAGTSTLLGAEVRIYDLDNTPAGSYGTELTGVESCVASTFTYPYLPASVGNSILVQVLKNGYVEYTQSMTLGAAVLTLTAPLILDTNA